MFHHFDPVCHSNYLQFNIFFVQINEELTNAYMVFHAEGLAEIELHYTAQLTVQPVRSFENGGHRFPVAESALPAVR